MKSIVHICCYGHPAILADRHPIRVGSWNKKDISNPLFFIPPRLIGLWKRDALKTLDFSWLVTGSKANIRQNFEEIMKFIKEALEENKSQGLPREVVARFHVKHCKFFSRLFRVHVETNYMTDIEIVYLEPSTCPPNTGLLIPYSEVARNSMVIAYPEAFSDN